MKRFVVGLLVLCLAILFTMPASALDVSATGSYYIAGYYDDNGDLMKNETATGGASNAWYNQRLRVQTTFTVNPALKLVTRFDAMEGIWGGDSGTSSNLGDPTATATDEKNLDFDRVYIEATTEYGMFQVGYQQGAVWGTRFADAESDVPRIKWMGKFGDWLVGAVIEKAREADHGTTSTDNDADKYMALVVNSFEGGKAGLLYVYVDNATYKSLGYNQNAHMLEPYAKVQIGDLYIETEADYWFGDYVTASKEVDLSGLSAYINAKYSFGPAYAGAQIAWVQGDDPSTTDEYEGGPSGFNYDPCLILWNDDLQKWSGHNLGNGLGGNNTGDTMSNAWLYQIYAGYSPIEKLDLFASFTYAKADEKGTAADDEIGSEIDITANYKLFDNLNYLVGFGYFFAGDWYKGATSNEVDDDYIVMNKLTLSF